MNTLTNPVKILHGKTLYDSSAKVRILHFINIAFTFRECCHGKSFQVCPNYDICMSSKRKCLVFSPSLKDATFCKNIHLVSLIFRSNDPHTWWCRWSQNYLRPSPEASVQDTISKSLKSHVWLWWEYSQVAVECSFCAIINSCSQNAAESADQCNPKPNFHNSGNDQWGTQISSSHIIVVISVCSVLVDCCLYH